jgi:hypothetical protein
MKEGVLWTLLGVLIAVKLVLLVEVYLGESQIQTSPQEGCNILQASPEGRVNLVFLATKEQSEIYSNYLKETAPFNQTKNYFNVYYIDNYEPSCEIYKEKAILCNSKELIEEASKCPNDYIIAIKNEKREIRSSSYSNILSINSAQPLSVLSHEFGHAFANLADEYVPSAIQRKQENCKGTCEDFDGVGCFQGCSKENYFRSDENGLMRTLAARQYGAFDEKLISNRLKENKESPITGNAVRWTTACLYQRYYLIEGEYKSGEINIIKKSVQNGCVGSNGFGGFEYVLIRGNGTEIKDNFNPEMIFTDGESDGEAQEYEGNFYLKIPMNEESGTLEIRAENKNLARINLFEENSLPCQI